MDWQPIETAPKDGKDILIVVSHHGHDCVIAGFWFDSWGVWLPQDSRGADGSEDYDDILELGTLTHWLPLPDPPEGK